jgi:hypothetical protein
LSVVALQQVKQTMVSDDTENGGAQLQRFCTIDSSQNYVYLGPLQDWLKFHYPENPFPDLQALAKQGKVLKLLTKKVQRKAKDDHQYDTSVAAYEYLRLHCYSGKFVQRSTCHAPEKGVTTFLNTIFNGSSDAADAIQFINNQNLTMLVTRRNYTNPLTYTDYVVALLSWTGCNKSVVYIGWAAVSGGQVGLPSPSADKLNPAYSLP